MSSVAGAATGEKDPIGAMLGLVSRTDAGGAPGTTPEEAGERGEGGDVDVEAEAFNAAASELLTAFESKNVSGIAAALRAACEAHYGAEKRESE